MDAVFAVCGIGTESWLDPSIKDGDIFPEEFKGNVYRKDRKSDHHGGVFVAIKNTFDSEEALYVVQVFPVYLGYVEITPYPDCVFVIT
jgi:hypothetical protein